MKTLSLTVSHILVAGIGVLVGALLFRLPQWDCGPFRSETAGIWAGACVALIAAIATYWAVIVAMRTSRDSLQAAFDQRAWQVAREEERRKAQALVVAEVCVGELYSVIGLLTTWELSAGDPLIRLDGIFHQASELRMSTIDRYADRFDLFESDDAALFGTAAMRARNFAKHASTYLELSKNWDANTQAYVRADMIANCVNTRKRVRAIYDRFMVLTEATNAGREPEEVGKAQYQASHDRAAHALESVENEDLSDAPDPADNLDAD